MHSHTHQLTCFHTLTCTRTLTHSHSHTYTLVEIRQALSKLLAMTMEPKSADIRRLSQKVIIGFFDLNPAALTLLLRNMSKTLQENANRILKGYMNDMSSSSGEESDKEVMPKKVRRRAGAATPTGMRVRLTGILLFNNLLSLFFFFRLQVHSFDPRPLRAVAHVLVQWPHYPPVDLGDSKGQEQYLHRPLQLTIWMVRHLSYMNNSHSQAFATLLYLQIIFFSFSVSVSQQKFW